MIVNKETMENLYVTFSAAYQEGLSLTPSIYSEVATDIPSSSAANQYNWVGDFPRFREWIGERQIKNVEVYDYTIRNRDYEATESLGRNEIEDNNLNMFATRIRQMGQITKTHPDELVFNLLKNGTTNLCYDGQPFFDTDHPVGNTTVSNIDNAGSGDYWYLLDTSNVIKPLIFQRRKPYEFVQRTAPTDDNVFYRKEFVYGVETRVSAGYSLWQMAFASNQTLDATNFAAAKQAMRELTTENGRALNINPTVLVVSPSNEGAAKVLLEATMIPNGVGGSQTNVYYNNVKLLVTQLVS